MMARHFVSLACAAVAVVSVVACRDRNNTDRERMGEQPYGHATVTGASVITNTSAVEHIVAARCERESSCRNVGPDKNYASSSACIEKLQADMRQDLNAQDCPQGVSQKELGECLTAIRGEACNNPIDTIGRLAACRTSDLCLKTR